MSLPCDDMPARQQTDPPAMISSLPLYLLFAEAHSDDVEAGRWRFSLEHVASGVAFSASDDESIECAERLELLAVVRGLEALEEPARVTLVTTSRYVSRGLRRGLAEWRHSGWRWERFGKLVPVRDWDLWRRVDRAMEFHQVECRLWQYGTVDADVADTAAVESVALVPSEPEADRGSLGRSLDKGRQRVGRLRRKAGRRLRRVADAAKSLGDSVGGAVLAPG